MLVVGGLIMVGVNLNTNNGSDELASVGGPWGWPFGRAKKPPEDPPPVPTKTGCSNTAKGKYCGCVSVTESGLVNFSTVSESVCNPPTGTKVYYNK